MRDKMQDHADMIERRYESVRAEKKKEHEESRKAGHAQILNETVKAIMKIDVSGINLFDDAQLADCQTVLERNRKLVDIYRPYVTDTAITFEYEVPSAEEFAERIRHTLEMYPYIVASAYGRILGYAGDKKKYVFCAMALMIAGAFFSAVPYLGIYSLLGKLFGGHSQRVKGHVEYVSD